MCRRLSSPLLRFVSSMIVDDRRWPADPVVLVAALLLAAILASYLAAMRVGPSAAVVLPAQGEASAALSRIMPQGWAFFTKPTLAATPVAFAPAGDGWERVAGVPNAQLRFAAGLSREGRRQGVEMASILHEVARSTWTTCTGQSLERCAGDKSVASVSNPLPDPTLCGELIVGGLKPTSWAWRQLSSAVTHVHEAVRVDVRCARA